MPIEDVRNIIVVRTFDIDETAAALPALLEQLVIPVSAVGAIVRPRGWPHQLPGRRI